MINKSFPVLPVPEIIESNLNHSFKYKLKDEHRGNKKPPKLYPKECSFIRNSNHEVHAISFKDQMNSSVATSTPKSHNNSSLDSHKDSLFSSFYDRKKNDSYFEQCYETFCKLGEGSFCEVFKVRCKDDGKFYAIKKTKQTHRSESHRRERLEEVKRYEQFSSNEHCVKYYKAWEQDDHLFMQIELCIGSVEGYIEEIMQVPETFVWSFLLDMLLALKSLHDQNLVHLDIKLDNILLYDENHCKLADFGLVFDLTNSQRSRAVEGDSRYVAPELMQGNCCLANDIFSLGVTLLELACSLELPANGKLWLELRSLVLPETAMKSLSPELQSIIRSMMEPDPARRPTVDRLLSNPKLKALNYQRKGAKIFKKCMKTFTSGFHIIKCYLLFVVFIVVDFFKLDKKTQTVATTARSSSIQICVQDYDENSDDESSCRTSLNNSRVSKISQADDDNNNTSYVTPTLNNSVPRITPEIKIANSTPLNHFTDHDGLSSRRYRRDVTKLSFDKTSPVVRSPKNSPQDREPFSCKKLFQDEDLDDL